MNQILLTLIISVGFNLVLFIPAYRFKTDHLTDISYALTFIGLAFFGFVKNTSTLPSVMLYLMILLWAGRLGVFLFSRIRKIGRDKRFDGMRENFWLFGRFWLLQGITVWVILIPAIFFFTAPSTTLSFLSLPGFLIWLAGLLAETIADLQKYRFSTNLSDRGKWIETGLWKFSRHPNYLGEIMVWTGVYLFVLPGLSTVHAWIGLTGPVFIALLLIFVSGIPILEKSADKKWGDRDDYLEYKKRVGVLVPKISLFH
ncbi:MAG: DUF1295 domain-containing protein [Bacteroidetes bacterium]|nr:DUF1295 domain-containing protein [Bacteroidota bacterium]